jgi:transcriptional regulator with XRE-family HTH domain
MSGALDDGKPAENDQIVALAGSIVRIVNEAAGLLRRFRLEKGLSQAEMASRMELSQPRVAQLESGKPGNAPSLEQLAEFAFHAGHAVALRDAAQLVAAETEHAALVRRVKGYEAQIERHRHQLEGLHERIRTLENAVGRAAIARRTVDSASEAHGKRRGLRDLVRDVGTRLFAEDPAYGLSRDFLDQQLSKVEIIELADKFQTFTQKGAARVDAVVDAVSGVLQRHVNVSGTHER